MTNAVRELKTRAEILHKRIQSCDSKSLTRLRVLPEFRRTPQQKLSELAPTIRRQHCLSILAAEWGFPNWPLAKRALAGEANATEFGSLLCPERCAAHFNRWYKSYAEAAEMRKKCDGYLLGFRRQFVVVDRYYIEALGLDPDDPDWRAIGFDWPRTRSLAARSRLYAKIVATLPHEAK
jgi:hypothetical protein